MLMLLESRCGGVGGCGCVAAMWAIKSLGLIE